MRYIITILSVFCLQAALAQGTAGEAKFHEGSNYFINGNPQAALASVNQGLQSDPGNRKLQALKKLLEEEKKKQDQQQKKDQQQKQQQKQEQQKQENKDKEGEKKEQQKEQEKDSQKNQDEQKKNEEEQQEKKEKEEDAKREKQNDIPQDVREKLEEMKIDPEKAKMILEAMRNQEVQYLQQQQRESTKPRERNKPDW